MSKKKKGSRRKQPDIPTELKSSLTPKMRAERGAETFENAGTAKSVSSDELVKSESSSRRSNKPHFSLAQNKTIRYENEPVSVYEVTCGTTSFESVVAGRELMGQKGAVAEQEGGRQKLRRVQLRKIERKRDEPVQEEQLLRGTLPGMVEQICWGRGEAEMDYIQTLVEDISTLLALSGRIDLLLQHSVHFQRNHLPVLRIQLGKKACQQEEEPIRLQLEERPLDPPPGPLRVVDLVQLTNAGLHIASIAPF